MTLYTFDLNKKDDYLKSLKNKQLLFNLIMLLVSFSPLLFILTSNYLNIFVFKPFYILILITFVI